MKANWILFARNDAGEPVVSAMDGDTTQKSLTGNSKDALVGFLNLFSNANTFLVAKPDGSDEEITALERLPRKNPNQVNNIVSADATWFHVFRDVDGQPLVFAMNGSRGVEFYQGNLKQGLIDFLNRHSSAHTFQVAPAHTPIPSGLPQWEPVLSSLKGQRVLLEIGHGPGVPFDPGAIAYDGNTTEHSLNLIAANAARQTLAAAGVACTIIDTPQGSLYNMGLNASGFDVFCSVHHNAANKKAQGAEAFSHATKGGKLDNQLADLIAAKVSKELGIANRGAKQARFGVLSGAEDTDVRAAVLAEVYFIDDQVRKPPLTQFSTRGGQAIGQAILEWLKLNP